VGVLFINTSFSPEKADVDPLFQRQKNGPGTHQYPLSRVLARRILLTPD
jgi:hypothetical protein